MLKADEQNQFIKSGNSYKKANLFIYLFKNQSLKVAALPCLSLTEPMSLWLYAFQAASSSARDGVTWPRSIFQYRSVANGCFWSIPRLRCLQLLTEPASNVYLRLNSQKYYPHKLLKLAQRSPSCQLGEGGETKNKTRSGSDCIWLIMFSLPNICICQTFFV